MTARRRLILHIGTEKTGTTSIQQFLVQNRKLLSEYNIFAPRSLDSGWGNHLWLPILADPEEMDEFLCRMRVANVKQRLASTRKKFFSEVNQCSSGQSCWVISSELLHSRLRSQESLLALRNILGQLFSEITILLYIRKPIDTAVSLWSTGLVDGFDVPCLPSPSHPYWDNACNHARAIRLWRDCFPESRFVVRLFQIEDFVNGDLISDFKAQIGLPVAAPHTAPQRQNESLSRLGMLSLSYFNRKFPRPSSGLPSPIHLGFRRFILARTSALPKYISTSQEHFDYESSFAESDAWVLHNIFPDREFLWTQSACGQHEKDRPPFALTGSEALFLDMLFELWCRGNAPPSWGAELLRYPKRLLNFLRMNISSALKC